MHSSTVNRWWKRQQMRFSSNTKNHKRNFVWHIVYYIDLKFASQSEKSSDEV